MYQQTKIMYGEKACQVTVTSLDGTQHQQWFCTKCRRIWGEKDQHMASWCCCTHKICECGQEHEKHYTHCDDCRAKKEHERWCAKPEVQWNGEFPIADHSSETYFFDGSSLLDYIDENIEDIEDAESVDDVVNSLRLSSCHQNKPRTFEINEWCNDDLAEDSDGVANADSIDERINAILAETGILSYSMNSDRLNVRQILTAIGYSVTG